MDEKSEEAPPETLILSLLGPPTLEGPGGSVPISRRKSLALLAFLALEPGRQPRDSLAALFWPECGQGNARANLRQCIFDLKRASGLGLVASEGEALWLAKGLMLSDIDRFKMLSAPCPRHGPAGACSECSGRLEAAARLWRGEFMSGFTLPDSCDFDQWQLSWSERLRTLYCETLRRLAAYYRAEERLDEAEDCAYRWGRTEPYGEEARRVRIEILLQAGRPARAVECYEEWARIAREELGRQPAASTRELVAHLLPPRPSTAESGARAQRRAELEEAAGDALIGRERELASIGAALLDPQTRIHTIIGAGGIGKTRLARAILAEKGGLFPGGSYFADLSSLRDPALVPMAIVSALGLCGARDGGEVEGLLAAALGEARALLVLDNFEQVAQARGLVASLRDDCPALVLAITSREPLGIEGEAVHELEPLAVPPELCPLGPAESVSYPALELLAIRAAEARRGFALTQENVGACASICARLDGMPLAIELAASRLATLEPQELLERLGPRLELISVEGRPGPERHRALRAVMDWSYELLAPEEKRLFSRLGSFWGGFDIAAAEAVAGFPYQGGGGEGRLIDALSSLVRKSLLRRKAEGDSSRFFFLESIEEYARERLEASPEAEDAVELHARHYLARAESLSVELRGRRQRDIQRCLEADRANYQAALERFIAAGEADAAYRLCLALEWHWYRSGRFAWSESALRSALALPPRLGSSALRGACQRAFGWSRFVQGSWREARGIFLDALPLLEAGGDRAGLASCLSDLGVTERWLGERSEGDARCLEAVALARKLGDSSGLAYALIWAYGTTGGKRVEEGQSSGLEEAVRLSREAGDPWAEAHALNGLGDYLRESGKPDEALPCFDEALRLFSELGDEWLKAWTVEGIGLSEQLLGDYAGAEERLKEALALFAKLGDRGAAVYLLGEVGLAASLAGERDRADLLLSAASSLAQGRETAAGSAPLGSKTSEMLDRAMREAKERRSAAWRQGTIVSYARALAVALEPPGT